MMINEDSTNSPTFSFFTNKELEQKDCIKQIDKVLEKYNILENDNQLISSLEKNILYTINYIETLSIKKEKIPKEVEDLFQNNFTFKEQINLFIEKKLLNITQKDSIYFFKDVNIMLHLLSIGTKEKIIESYNIYNFNSLSNLFRFYEAKLKFLFLDNTKLFNLTFDSYIVLLRTITQLCSFNSIDIIAKKNIRFFLELMTESINLLKFSVLLDEEKLNKLNNIQGKYLYYFSHIDEIKFELNDLNTTFKNYLLTLERHEDGYILSKESNFGNETENLDSQEFLIFKMNSSILILKLIKELKKSLDEVLYFESEHFQRILRFYYKKFSLYLPSEDIVFNLADFQNDLLNALLTNYQLNQDFLKKLDYHLIIDDFVFSQQNTSNTNLEIIYKLLYFADDIPIYKYHQITQILADYKPIKNDYHEFFKLEIFDLTVNKSMEYKYSTEIEELLNKIYLYVNNYKIASHLLSVYSKIYLSLSLFYSTNQVDLEKAKNLYSTFIQINGLEILQKEYSDINLSILDNLKTSSELILKEFLRNKNIALEYELLDIKDKINKNISSDEIKISIRNFISNTIFHGLSVTYILEINQELDSLDAGFEDYKIVLPKYIIRLIFTSVYKTNFLSIFDENRTLIENNICNILNNLKEENKKINILIDDEDEIEINY
ncbi:MAG: hypothetical protein PHY66_00480 [Aliarcobacter sp.]|nr:hypothetical protein [Aliarcobacter sp.]